MTRPGTSRPRCRDRARDDAGSMAMYLMFAIVGMALGALIVPMVITQARTTRSDTSRVHALDAAQAGLNVMVGQLRDAQTDGKASIGDNAKLPCTDAGAVTGRVGGAGSPTYSVTLSYYQTDPVADPTSVIKCLSGVGTASTPKFARITSVGSDGPAVNGNTPGRTLETTYIFRNSNTNIDGGPIRIYPASGTSPELCIDAGAASPAAGALVTLRACATTVLRQQIFAYRSDLTLQLLSSVTATYPNGLCLDTAPPPTAGRQIFLGACAKLTVPSSPVYTQAWSFNDNGGYTASLPNSSLSPGTLSTQCMYVANQAVGTPLTLAACSGGGTGSPTQAWIPSPAVGAGAAQKPQLINYYEFGRCLDVTGQNVNSNHLIDFPCKQNPFSGAVAWNQKFTTPGWAAEATSAQGQIFTTTGGTNYCLTSPGTDGGYVTVLPCSGSNTRQVWTVYNGLSPLSYTVKYTIVDSATRCLDLADPVGSEAWSSIVVAGCTGGAQQKWNAQTNLSSSVLQDTAEVATPG